MVVDDIPESSEGGAKLALQAANFIPTIISGISISGIVAGLTRILVEDSILDGPRKNYLQLFTGQANKRKILIVLPAFVISQDRMKEIKEPSRRKPDAQESHLYQPGICSGQDREDYLEAPDWVMISGRDLSGATSLINKITALRLSNCPVEIWFDNPYEPEREGGVSLPQSIFAGNIQEAPNSEDKKLEACRNLELNEKLKTGNYLIISIGLRSNELTNYIFNRRQIKIQQGTLRNQQSDPSSEGDREISGSVDDSPSWLDALERGDLKKETLRTLCPPPHQEGQKDERSWLIARVNLPGRLIKGQEEEMSNGNVIFIVGGSGPEETSEMCSVIAEEENLSSILNYQDNHEDTQKKGKKALPKPKVNSEGVDSFYVLYKADKSTNESLSMDRVRVTVNTQT